MTIIITLCTLVIDKTHGSAQQSSSKDKPKWLKLKQTKSCQFSREKQSNQVQKMYDTRRKIK